MGHLLRLRVSLANRAGALAQAATVIGLHGGNILSIDVHRTDGPSAVDDVVVDFPEKPDLDDLEYDLATNAATTLLTREPVEPEDPVVGSLRWAELLLDRTTANRDTVLEEAVASLSCSSRAWVADHESAIRFAAGRGALDGPRSVVERTTDVPPAIAAGDTEEMWLAAIPESDGAAGRVLFVGKPPSTPFTATELERVEAFLRLHRRATRPGGPARA